MAGLPSLGFREQGAPFFCALIFRFLEFGKKQSPVGSSSQGIVVGAIPEEWFI